MAEKEKEPWAAALELQRQELARQLELLRKEFEHKTFEQQQALAQEIMRMVAQSWNR